MGKEPCRPATQAITNYFEQNPVHAALAKGMSDIVPPAEFAGFLLAIFRQRADTDLVSWAASEAVTHHSDEALRALAQRAPTTEDAPLFEVGVLRSRVEELSLEIARRDSRISDLLAQINTQRTELQVEHDRVSRLRDDLALRERQYNELSSNNVELQRKLEEKTAQLEAALDLLEKREFKDRDAHAPAIRPLPLTS